MPEAASPPPLPLGQGVWTAPNVSAKTERTLQCSKKCRHGDGGNLYCNSGQFYAVLFMAADQITCQHSREVTLFVCT